MAAVLKIVIHSSRIYPKCSSSFFHREIVKSSQLDDDIDFIQTPRRVLREPLVLPRHSAFSPEKSNSSIFVMSFVTLYALLLS